MKIWSAAEHWGLFDADQKFYVDRFQEPNLRAALVLSKMYYEGLAVSLSNFWMLRPYRYRRWKIRAVILHASGAWSNWLYNGVMWATVRTSGMLVQIDVCAVQYSTVVEYRRWSLLVCHFCPLLGSYNGMQTSSSIFAYYSILNMFIIRPVYFCADVASEIGFC